MKGIDALLTVKTNPTSFQNFEVQYKTRGELGITAFNSASGSIRYSVQAGRLATAKSFLTADEIRKLRVMFETALAKLTSTPAKS